MRSIVRVSCALLLAACGGGSDTPIDAAGADAADDDAAATNTVIVTTVDWADPPQPAGGIPIWVNAADGSVRANTFTDASGRATIDAVSGDVVTAVYGRSLQSLVAVEPGYELTFRGGSPPASEIQTMTLTWTADPAVTGWAVAASCTMIPPFEAGFATLERFLGDCPAATVDILLAGYDDSSRLIRSARLDGVTWEPGGEITMPAPAAPVSAFAVAITGLPAEVDRAEISVSPLLDAWNGGGGIYVQGEPIGGALSTEGPWPGAPDGARLSWTVERNGFGEQGGVETLPPNATSASIDSPALLPWISDFAVNAAARHAVWLQSDGAAYDLAMVSIYWQHSDLRGFTWTIVVPPGTTGVELPQIGNGLAPLSDDAAISGRVELLEWARWHDYGAVGAAPPWLPGPASSERFSRTP